MKILNFTKAMCPYDHIIVETLKEVLPEVIIRGSLFSFVKLMTRKWSSLDLPKDYTHTVFKTSMILKLLPPEKVKEGIKVVKHQAELESDRFEDLLAFAKFAEKCSPLIEESTFTGDNINEAIDYAESHNLHMVKQLGKHEGLHSFLKLLKINI
ncbi:GSCOCG00011566001-RA-CDS [Cotesia congregata]|nr:GSCOCG00011566001-RA-CDS [Cotesia congregata]